MENTADLIKRIRLSDAAAFKELFDLYHQDVFNFLYYKTGNVEAAEDILQDVFIKIWERKEQLKTETSIKSFLFTIANHAALNFIRHNKIVMKFQMEELQKPAFGESPHVALERKNQEELLMESISNLPEKPRVTFMMCKFDGLSYKEVASRLNISVKTVEGHIGRALKMLREDVQQAVA